MDFAIESASISETSAALAGRGRPLGLHPFRYQNLQKPPVVIEPEGLTAEYTYDTEDRLTRARLFGPTAQARSSIYGGKDGRPLCQRSWLTAFETLWQ